MRKLIALAVLGTAMFASSPAQAGDTCPFKVVVKHSLNGGRNGTVDGFLYPVPVNGQVNISQGSKNLKVRFLDGEEVLYRQNVRAIPNKTTMRVRVGIEVDTTVTALRAGADPKSLVYGFTCA